MKVTALINYRDLKTGACYNAGQRIEYADDRAAELAEKGFVKPEETAVAQIPKLEKKSAPAKRTTKKK